jgi:hypothetical protein
VTIDEFLRAKTELLLQEVGDEQRRIIKGLWEFELLFQPSPWERLFHYRVVSAMIQAQGASYMTPNERSGITSSLMGCDIARILPSITYNPLRIAVVDSFLGAVDSGLVPKVSVLNGSPIHKARRRAELLVQASETLVPSTTAKVLNVGAVASFVKALRAHGHQVTATDLDPAIVGRQIGGVTVESGDRTLELLSDADLAVVTGMTLANGSLDEIIGVARSSHTRVLLFAETGAYIAEHLCAARIIDAVFSEPFPFYIFQGQSKVRFSRMENLQ